MYRLRVTSLNPNNFWVLLRNLPTASSKFRICSMAEEISSHQFVSSFHTCITSKPISHILCNSILFGSCTVRNLSQNSENPNVFPQRWMSSSSNQQQSFTVSYLINSIGLSPQTALSASKHVNFETSENPDKVINLLKKYGFTMAQISSLVRVTPTVVLSDSEKTILPKLEFLKAKGISGPQMTKSLSLFPTLLRRSLNKRIIPSYDFLLNFFQSDEKLTRAVKRYPDILFYNVEKYVAPNIDILREHGVPDSKIADLMLSWPMSFMVSSDHFRTIVEKVKDLGFDAYDEKYVVAVAAFRRMDKSKWQNKVDTLKKWGLCEDEILNVFRKRPRCMMLSEDNLMAHMDFFMNQMALKPCTIVKHPILLQWSLKKRIIPRFSVFQVLLSKGLVEEKVNVKLFNGSDEKFLQKFVMPYKKEAPKLLKLFKENLNLLNGCPAADKV